MYPGEAVLPDALEEVGNNVFYDCPEIKAIWVRNRSVADSLKTENDYNHDPVAILPERTTMVGNTSLHDIRR